ncbi:MAG: pyroglutamyl-peptidase I, partial [Cyanobacteria bacterium P01_G01_bin.49]
MYWYFEMRVLITGFEPNDNGLNASELVVISLRDNPTQELSQHAHCLDFKIMPGNTNILGQVVDETLKAVLPDICIGIGQARGYNRIALERMAKNIKYFVTLDRAGNAPKGEQVVPNAPVGYWNSLPEQDSLVSLLESHNIPAKVSNDCGTHLCNQVFYHFLHWRETYKPDMKVGFVHIPLLPEQIINYWAESPFMPMEMTRQACMFLQWVLLSLSNFSLPTQTNREAVSNSPRGFCDYGY